MAKKVSINHKRKQVPEWIFPWRPLGQASFPKVFAILSVGGFFAFFLTFVRIRVAPPSTWAARKASVIQVTDDVEGQALTLRAQEGGPFPSRFEPSGWEGLAALEQTALDAVRGTRPPYVPVLRSLPEEKGIPPVELAAKGEAVLPRRSATVAPGPTPVKLKLSPVLLPLSGIPPAAMPHELPPFEGALDAATSAEPWRFLVRLDSAGHVQDCVSLAGGNEAGPPPLETWLRRVSFQPEPAKPSRWIAVGVGFTNQPADGTDAR